MNEVVPRRKRLQVVPAPERPLVARLTQMGSPHLRRGVQRWLLLVIAFAVLVPLALWIHYRAAYVVSRNAQVKGSITNLGAQFDGVVTSVEAENGQQIRAGQVLARFEDHQLQ